MLFNPILTMRVKYLYPWLHWNSYFQFAEIKLLEKLFVIDTEEQVYDVSFVQAQ